jgi:WD40 repeat protein
VAGAGFLVGEGALVTCAHVVEAAGAGPGGRVLLAFPGLDGAPQVAGVVLEEAWRARDAGDVAVVRLDAPLAAPALALGAAAGCRGHRVRSFGFPRHSPPGGHHGYGTAGDLLPAAASAGGLLQLTDANDLTTGFSGAPVIDEVTGLVIGMINAIIAPDHDLRGTGIAYAIPTETLRQVWPALAVSEVCPYRGLEPFTAEHAAWFHGRSAAVAEVLAGLRKTPRAMLLLGPSGAGKSSLIQAGVLPALAAGELPSSDRWVPALARPGQDLPATLDRAQPDGRRVLLVIDQVEELLTNPSAADQLTTLHAAILDGPAARTVVLVMRDDFYPQLAAQAPELLKMLTPGLLNLPATLSRQDLRDIIVKPAAAVGLRCQDGLAELIVRDALAADPDASAAGHAPATVLPLLELTLRQLWERRADGFLTHDAYQRIGGVTGSLATWCDTAIAQLPADHRPAAELILTALVRPADDTRHIPAVRQQVPLATLRDLAGHTADDVLAALTAHRIVTTRTTPDVGVPVAELVHDALIRDWPALREWVSRDHRFHDWLRRADEQRARWANRNDPGDLLHGTDLAEGIDWSTQRRLPHQTVEFLDASRQRQQAGIRRARRLNTILATLLAAALTAAGLALWQRQTAVDAQRVALSRQLAAQSAKVIDTDADLASLLAVHAYRTSPTTEAATSLYTAAAVLPDGRLTGHTYAVTSVAFSPDGRTLATASSDGTRLWDIATGKTRTTLPGHEDVESLQLSSDGRALATVSSDGRIRLWDTATGKTRTTLPADRPADYDYTSLALSPDGRTLAIDTDEGTRLWDTTTGKARATLDREWLAVFSPDGHTLATASNEGTRLWDTTTWKTRTTRKTRTTLTRFEWPVAFSPDGHTLATSSNEGTVRIWDTTTWKTRTTFTRVGWSVAFSPDGHNLVTVSDDGTVRIWDTTTWKTRTTLARHSWMVASMAFSPDGGTLATGSNDGAVWLWDVSAGRTRATLTDHADAVTSVAFSPDGRTLATGSNDNTARLWDTTTGQTRATLTGHNQKVMSVAFSPDGRILATASWDGTARLWNTATGQDRATLTHTGVMLSVAFSPDKLTLATASIVGTARLWDSADRRTRATLTGHTDTVTSVAFSPDGRTLATGSNDSTARLWDTTTSQTRATLDHPDGVTSVAFSPDGRTLATGSNDNTARLWDTTTGQTRATLTGHTDDVTSVAFSPDGRTLATGSADHTTRLWSSVALPGSAAAISKICRAVGRDFTPSERATYQAPATVCPS